MALCYGCGGSGHVTCPNCHGQVGKWVARPGGPEWEPCFQCGGRRQIPCPTCNGTGRLGEGPGPQPPNAPPFREWNEWWSRLPKGAKIALITAAAILFFLLFW